MNPNPKFSPLGVLTSHTPAEFVDHLLYAKKCYDECLAESGVTKLDNLRRQIPTFTFHQLQNLFAFLTMEMLKTDGPVNGLRSAFSHIIIEHIFDDLIARAVTLRQEADPDAIVGE